MRGRDDATTFPRMALLEGEQTHGVAVGDALPVQVYSTTVYAEGLPPARFVTIPDAALEQDAQMSLENFIDIFGLGRIGPSFYPSQLPRALWGCLAGTQERPTGNRDSMSVEHQRLLTYCDYLAFAPIIPIEASDLDKKSLGGLMATGAGLGAGLGGAVVGAKVGVGTGIVVGSAGGPLVIVAVAVGFVVSECRRSCHRRHGRADQRTVAPAEA